MRALSPTGEIIVGTADLVPGNALVNSVELSSEGMIEIEWAGDTELCWNGQRTNTCGGPRDAADDLLAAAKLAEGRLALLMTTELPESDHPTATGHILNDLREAIAKASTPEQDLWVSEDGMEWPESELTLVDDLKHDAATAAGYAIKRDGAGYRLDTPEIKDGGPLYATQEAAWLAAFAEMENAPERIPGVSPQPN